MIECFWSAASAIRGVLLYIHCRKKQPGHINPKIHRLLRLIFFCIYSTKIDLHLYYAEIATASQAARKASKRNDTEREFLSEE
jgi:hypothetical protein